MTEHRRMTPDEQFKRRGDDTIVGAYRIMVVTDAKGRGETAETVLARLAAVVDGIPAIPDGVKRDYFTPWLEAVRHVYGPEATAVALAALQPRRGPQ